MSDNNFPVTPFEDIALMMSGGGYRAAAFHLGSLSYLDQVTFMNKSLLKRVKVLSTISGGTFPGVLYAQAIHDGLTFNDFYHRLLDFLENEDLVKLALEKIGNYSVWKETTKNRSMINAFAMVYDEKLFGKSTKKNFGMLWDCDSHLEEVIFNATEFDRGLAFRFQKTLDDKGIIGNYYLHVPPEQAKTIRFGDIIAASSCFPAGFEPICFPNDFLENKDTTLECYQFKPNPEAHDPGSPFTVGLMDGGIIDNQGIESIVLSEKRREQSQKIGKSLDLLIVSDVAGPFMKPFKFEDPESLTFKGFRLKSIASSKNFLYKLSIASLFFLLLLIAMLTGSLKAPLWVTYLTFTLVVINVVTALIGWFLKIYFGKIFYSGFDKFYQQYFPFLFNLPVSVLEPMIKNRFNSMIQMVSEVFMKQIRRLVYAKIYENEKWENRRISNQIYALKKDQIETRLERIAKYNQKRKAAGKNPYDYPDEVLYISEKITAVAELASSMGTTLWFSPEDKGTRDQRNSKLEALVTCGQFTICFNLLRYLSELRSEGDVYDNHPLKKEMEALYTALLNDWRLFQDNPHWLYDRLKTSGDHA